MVGALKIKLAGEDRHLGDSVGKLQVGRGERDVAWRGCQTARLYDDTAKIEPATGRHPKVDADRNEPFVTRRGLHSMQEGNSDAGEEG